MDAACSSEENVVCDSFDEINIDRNHFKLSINLNSTFENSFLEINSDSQGSIISNAIQPDTIRPGTIQQDTIRPDSKHLHANISTTSHCQFSNSERGSVISESAHQQELFSKFQTWALKNYGESGKTKTVTRSKYRKVINILKGVENAITENSKLRFWVKGKGFKLGRGTKEFNDVDREVLYIPAKNSCCLEVGERSLKRVAVVEDFFQIIYNVHVEMDGRGGKHAGQKRTYRAIAETYAFLPREAVTKFLMSCADCQKRMHLSIEHFDQKLIGRTSPLKYSKIESRDQMKYRRSVKRVKGQEHQESSNDKHFDNTNNGLVPTNEFIVQKKMKVEYDHVTNYNSKRDWLMGGASYSNEIMSHSGELIMESSIEDMLSSDLPLDLSTSKQINMQQDIPPETSIKHIEQKTIMEILPTKHLLNNNNNINNNNNFFSNFYLNTPFISNYFFRNFSAYKSSLPYNKFHFPTDLNLNEDFYGPVLRTYHYEESSHFQLSPRNGYNLHKLSNLRQILSLPQIIAGYRDSATYLKRSADELECLLQRTV